MNFFSGLVLAEFDLKVENIFSKGENTFFIIKENWDYQLALKFQEEMVSRVYTDKEKKVFIICNHPHCLTLGRGLQRRTKLDNDLVDFDETLRSELEVPLYDIKRGGGLTFHYPGQLVLYPVISLENQKLKVMDFLKKILIEFKLLLEESYAIEELSTDHSLIGLWQRGQKLASIGLCSHKFITYHGFALNLYNDELMNSILAKVYPCGISGSRYISLTDLTSTTDDLFNDIATSLLNSSSESHSLFI